MTNNLQPKVICLGLGRTGTLSLHDALEILGFGPCYHMTTLLRGRIDDFAMWSKIGDGDATSEEIRSFLEGFGSLTDYPSALYGPDLYAAYPDAKYILTTRDPAKWEKSVKATIMKGQEALHSVTVRSPISEALMRWTEKYMREKYHRGRMFTHSQQELLDHNERVKQLIPPEKLLIYEVGEGWERLVEFLGVPTPTVPFPHVNDTQFFQKHVQGIKDYAAKHQAQRTEDGGVVRRDVLRQHD